MAELQELLLALDLHKPLRRGPAAQPDPAQRVAAQGGDLLLVQACCSQPQPVDAQQACAGCARSLAAQLQDVQQQSCLSAGPLSCAGFFEEPAAPVAAAEV